MNTTTYHKYRFPTVLVNQNFDSSYYVVPLEQSPGVFLDDEFARKLHAIGWFETTNAVIYLESRTGSGPRDWRYRELYGNRKALVKEVSNAESYIPYGDLREAFGMPRGKEFAKVNEVRISLTIPYAMNALPDKARDEYLRAVEQAIDAYVRLGQDDLHVYHRYSRQTLDIQASVTINGETRMCRKYVAIVDQHPEWKHFVAKITAIAQEARKAIVQYSEYDQVAELQTS